MMASILTAVVGSVVTLAALSAAVGVIAKAPFIGRPLRWLWTTNVSHPVGAWHREITESVIDDRIEHLMHHRNGGSSLLDLAEAVDVVKADVSVLLEHDRVRDVPGARYGTDTDNEGEAP